MDSILKSVIFEPLATCRAWWRFTFHSFELLSACRSLQKRQVTNPQVTWSWEWHPYCFSSPLQADITDWRITLQTISHQLPPRILQTMAQIKSIRLLLSPAQRFGHVGSGTFLTSVPFTPKGRDPLMGISDIFLLADL